MCACVLICFIFVVSLPCSQVQASPHQQTTTPKRVPEELDSSCHRNINQVESPLETNPFKRTPQQAQAAANQPVHTRIRSYDLGSRIQLEEQLGELPPGWEQTRTPEGQIYYLE